MRYRIFIRDILVITSIGVLSSASALAAHITARTSRTSVAQGEPVKLVFEIDGDMPGSPDLSPLQQDFDILNRSTHRSMRSINGIRSQRTQLTLMLVPRHGGQLRIPSIAFGRDRSQPLTITAAGGPAGRQRQSEAQEYQAPGPSVHPGPRFRPREMPQARVFEPPAYAAPGPWQQAGPSQWSIPAPPDGFSGVAPGPAFSDRQVAPYPYRGQEPGFGSAVPMPPQEVRPVTAPDGEISWLWAVSALLGLAWLITGFAWWRYTRNGGEPKPRPARTPRIMKPIAVSRLEDAVATVAAAYRRGDPVTARDALLSWAAMVWKSDPPSNLSRLAARCDNPLKAQIVKLEDALFSPAPARWNDVPIREMLLRESDRIHPPPGFDEHGLAASNP